MQKDLEANHPDLQIQFLGVNQWSHEGGRETATNGRDLPLLQDVDGNKDNLSDVWASWDVAYRDVIVVDAVGEIVDVYNLSTHDLTEPGKYDALKQIVIDAAESAPLTGDCNQDGVLDAADLACVSSLPERDAVLEALELDWEALTADFRQWIAAQTGRD